MNRYLSYAAICILVMLTAAACKKSSKPPAATPPTSPTSPTTPTGTGETDVYIAGVDSAGDAVYWKNGKMVILAAGPGSYAKSIFVSDTNVYAAGGLHSNGRFAKSSAYWINGSQGAFNGGRDTLACTGIWFANNNIYVAVNNEDGLIGEYKISYEMTLAASGTSTENALSGEGNSTSVNAVTVSGTDVYNVGSDMLNFYNSGGSPNYGAIPVIWKNYQEHELPNVAALQDNYTIVTGYATAVAVSGGNVYAVGAEADGASVPVLWVNDSASLLGVQIENNDPIPPNGEAMGVAVSGTDAYTTGWAYNGQMAQAVLWKNTGATTFLAQAGISSQGSSIFVNGTDVYICGYDEDNNQVPRAVYWKNGVETFLAGGGNFGNATSIFVVQH
jgi:hypothetical protein